MKIGAMELIVIFIVALIVIGPDKLPSYAKKFGNALREFKKASADMTQDIRESVVEPLEEAQRPLREAMEPLEELKKDVEGNLKGVEKDLKSIGKTKSKEKEKADSETADTAAESPQAEEPPLEVSKEAAEEPPSSEPKVETEAASEPINQAVDESSPESPVKEVTETTGGTT